MANKLVIKQWAEEDRPREKMILKGVSALSNAELLAILIGSGTREYTAVQVAQGLLERNGNSLQALSKQTLNQLQKEKGIGSARSVVITAALELGKRRNHEEAKQQIKVTTSEHAYQFLQPLLCDLLHEEFWVLYLNRANTVIDSCNLSSGGTSGTVIDVRMVMKRGVELLASSIIVAHNHPSGNNQPSDADIQITKKLSEAGNLLDIKVIDHIIVCEHTFYSFADKGLI